MPEIAEVEIVRRGLTELVGQTLIKIEAEPRLALAAQAAEVEGRRLNRVKRHGKLLGLVFADRTIAAHLRMTGNFSLGEPQGSVRARLRFEHDQLAFGDPRGFGTLEVVPTPSFAGNLGPDLFELPPAFVPPAADSARSVKAVLLDQGQVAGIGNYLADEALWSAEVAPTRPARELKAADWKRILEAARKTAEGTLEAGGVSIRDYVDVDGNPGDGQSLLRCYGRAGQPCLRCGTELTKGKVAGRGTTRCPVCQT